jgi:tRNA-Thr(GGU) m(6)t(6)A37 methyltransferase TsaA
MMFEITPIGIVRSDISEGREMPLQGVPAIVEIFDEFKLGLNCIEGNTHINVICWFDKADRNVLLVTPRKINPYLNKQGVFSLRSPARPNPVSITATRLVKVEGKLLYVDPLDLIDGSPVIDIKPYSTGQDVIFWARDVYAPLLLCYGNENIILLSLLREAFNYHGERCPEIAVGAKVAFDAMKFLNCDIKDTCLKLPTKVNSHVADSLIGLTRATLGNRKLELNRGNNIEIEYMQTSIQYKLKDILDDDPFAILKRDQKELFIKRERKVQ